MIRAFQPVDSPALLELLRLNTPAYFHPSEEKDFKKYLEQEVEHYFIVEEAGKITGCGGFNFHDGGKTAVIAWDIIHPAEQGKGLGARLTRYRIDKIKEYPQVKTILVRTSQLTYPFYAKFGFGLKEVIKDYWAPGFDLYRMEMDKEQ